MVTVAEAVTMASTSSVIAASSYRVITVAVFPPHIGRLSAEVPQSEVGWEPSDPGWSDGTAHADARNAA